VKYAVIVHTRAALFKIKKVNLIGGFVINTLVRTLPQRKTKFLRTQKLFKSKTFLQSVHQLFLKVKSERNVVSLMDETILGVVRVNFYF
jgi:hypothetical protein